MRYDVLAVPIHLPDRRVLLPVGTVVSEESVGSLIEAGRGMHFPSIRLLNAGSIRQDMIDFLSTPPYHIIFSDRKSVQDILAFMEQVSLLTPFLETLDYFRQYDHYTYRHTLMVFALSTLLARELLTDHRDQLLESSAGPIHDIGKICVPLCVLQKQTPLTRPELRILRQHTIIGHALTSYYLRDASCLAARVTRDHHERLNGSGYPHGALQRDPLIEIIVVSDMYDALISPRPYRPVSFDNRTAIDEIISMSERGEIGWEVAKALVSFNRKNKTHFSDSVVSLEKRGVPPKQNMYGMIADDPGCLEADKQ